MDMLQGEDNASVPYRLGDVRPERVWNVEAGLDLTRGTLSAGLNGYVMEFRDEIALTGELSEIGLPTRRNVDRSFRRGIEADLRWAPHDKVRLRHTAAYRSTASGRGRSITTSTTTTAHGPALSRSRTGTCRRS